MRLLRRLAREPRLLLPVFEHFVVFSADPRTIAAPTERPGVLFRPLTDAEVASLDQVPGLNRLARRHRQCGVNASYGIFVDGRLAHARWITTAALESRLPDPLLHLRSDEVEAGLSFTVPEFRGRGLQAHGLRESCRIAREAGTSRVLSLTKADNHASRRGLTKAGFQPCGRLLRLSFPWMPSWAALRWSGHRIGRAGQGRPTR
jgi:RimJ/RimL family protein N-acetyltransferase